MVAGKHKSRSMRRVYIKTPGGTNKISYRSRKPTQAKCAKCKANLSGVSRATKAEITNMPKSAKRPERPYGGFFCSKCTREALREKARQTKI